MRHRDLPFDPKITKKGLEGNTHLWNPNPMLQWQLLDINVLFFLSPIRHPGDPMVPEPMNHIFASQSDKNIPTCRAESWHDHPWNWNLRVKHYSYVSSVRLELCLNLRLFAELGSMHGFVSEPCFVPTNLKAVPTPSFRRVLIRSMWVSLWSCL